MAGVLGFIRIGKKESPLRPAAADPDSAYSRRNYGERVSVEGVHILESRLEFYGSHDEIMAWVVQALRQSHGDEKRFHEEAIVRLRHEYDQLQRRIEAMYEDKLDGRVTAAFFDQ